ncbi:Gfo/Idh/MocA family protein [Allonocardiopsis opalescens]|uniref:Putative dehydrogenase n=1 Tax=Allonocardiopsis opalescens TaxID=1144618 RepID=A0A2T0QEB8_9ACTN|nr:Gfo/Idh/MocA family oxidoreductase [Allonocardiopsis opalescens]PRY02277.1 putative dehydrogenase [Allonocardiopsis opalescens]
MAPAAGAGRPVRVGVIGAGYGAATHLPAYAALPEFELVAVATRGLDTARAAAERFGAPRYYADHRELCADPEVELVDVVTRPSLHEPMAAAAARAGKAVLCEAPLAAAADSAERMRAAVRAAGVPGYLGLQSRFSPGLWELRRQVAEGAVGRVENVRAAAFYSTFTRPEAVRPSLWCADAGTGAGSLRVHGLHTLDLIRWIFGEPDDATVRGHTAALRPGWPGDAEATSSDSAAVVGRLAGGALFSVHTSWVAWHGGGWTLEVYGDAGMLRATAAGHTGHFPVRLTGAGRAAAAVGTLAPRSDAYDVAAVERDSAGYPLARLLVRLARELRTGERDPDLPTFDDGARLLRLADRIEPPAG